MRDDRRRDVRRPRAVTTELQHHRDDDLRIVGGREADKPRMIQLDAVLSRPALRRSRLSRK